MAFDAWQQAHQPSPAIPGVCLVMHQSPLAKTLMKPGVSSTDSAAQCLMIQHKPTFECSKSGSAASLPSWLCLELPCVAESMPTWCHKACHLSQAWRVFNSHAASSSYGITLVTTAYSF